MKGQGQDQAARRERSQIQSVSRALDLLEALSQEKLGLVELGRRTGLQPSTTHRMLATLTERGYAERMECGRYTLGHRSANLGGALSARERELMSAVRPLMQRVHAVTRQAVHLTVLEGDEVVFVYQLVQRNRLNAVIHDNVRLPAHVSASGKALLAFASTSRHERNFPALKSFTRQTIVEQRDLERELETIRQRGYALDRREYRPDISCVASPLFDHTGRMVAAMSVSGHSDNISPDLHDDFAELVVNSASEASEALGYTRRSWVNAG